MALSSGAGCYGPCEYEETVLDLDAPTSSGMTIGDELAAVVGPFAGTWRWYSSREELTIDGGGVEFPAQVTFVPDLGTLHNREHVGGGGEREFCGDRGIRVNGMLTFTDEQGATIVDIPILLERWADGPTWSYEAGPFYSPISEFSTRLHENFDYDRSSVAGRIRWIEGGLAAEFTWGGENTVSPNSGAVVFFMIAEFE
jgi:hypothetical protein